MKVLKPLKGIESNKYQPIVRALKEVKATISPLMIKLTDFKTIYEPLNKVSGSMTIATNKPSTAVT